MLAQKQTKINLLLNKGVKISNPQSVDISDDVKSENISGYNVSIYSGCKIFGNTTVIMPGAKIGYEGPVTIENCQIGPDVELKAGFFKDTVFLKGAKAGSGSHVREGSIFEEEAGIAQSVGLKQTILFPFVTLGSLINFCDCLMAGGTSRKNHSEVGSSYIHFNFTPDQDKATPSLIGDVPNGVMLNQKPIFLGGQGGLVGPCRLNFGTVTAAGTICRKDVLEADRLIFGGNLKSGNVSVTASIFKGIKRKLQNNIIYIANLFALKQWYDHVRPLFISDEFPEALSDGLKDKLEMAIVERIKRLGAFVAALEDNLQNANSSEKRHAGYKEVVINRDLFSSTLDDLQKDTGDISMRDYFLERILKIITAHGKDYIRVIQSLDEVDSKKGSLWLQRHVDSVSDRLLSVLPSFK
ncbi:MAG: protein GlmU [Desulfobacterales bacterium]|nr:protein GlmU [Desulfobacterales bacterium]